MQKVQNTFTIFFSMFSTCATKLMGDFFFKLSKKTLIYFNPLISRCAKFEILTKSLPYHLLQTYMTYSDTFHVKMLKKSLIHSKVLINSLISRCKKFKILSNTLPNCFLQWKISFVVTSLR